MTTSQILTLLLPFALGAFAQFLVGELAARRRLKDTRADCLMFDNLGRRREAYESLSKALRDLDSTSRSSCIRVAWVRPLGANDYACGASLSERFLLARAPPHRPIQPPIPLPTRQWTRQRTGSSVGARWSCRLRHRARS